jgi:hypothetical protein
MHKNNAPGTIEVQQLIKGVADMTSDMWVRIDDGDEIVEGTGVYVRGEDESLPLCEAAGVLRLID